jgi:hypothetical protein
MSHLSVQSGVSSVLCWNVLGAKLSLDLSEPELLGVGVRMDYWLGFWPLDLQGL